MSKKIDELEFIRVISAVGIIMHHFVMELPSHNITSPIQLLAAYPNGSFGWLFVTLFFILSGTVLRYRYKEVPFKEFGTFYYKRWLSIFPPFYILWAFLFVLNASEYHMFTYRGSKWPVIFTLIGMDGYVANRFTTYYIIGEWFLGAIILVYIVYPFMLKLYNRNKWIVGIILVALLAVEIHYNIAISSGPFRGVASSALSFYLGMLYVDFKELLDKKRIVTFSIALVISGVFLTLGDRIKIHLIWQVHILGIALFITLVYIGRLVMKLSLINKCFVKLGGLSYCVFLVQHVALNKILDIYYGRTFNVSTYLIVLAFTIVWVFALSYVLQLASGSVTGLIKNVTLKKKKA
ncbi:MAG: acyltransferase [Clostridia bacterium]|nr:acyltransferase [Clostridia bacterium]